MMKRGNSIIGQKQEEATEQKERLNISHGFVKGAGKRKNEALLREGGWHSFRREGH